MLYPLVFAGAAYLLLRAAARPDNKPEPLPEPEPEPVPEPAPEPMDYDEYATWSGEATVGENVVWTYQKMLRYSDGSTIKNGSEYIVIGNANHTSFLRANSDRGTVDIPARFSGGSADMDNVIVFPSIEAAVAELEEEDDSPTSPTDPQREPENPPPTAPAPLLPTQPDYGLGGGGASLFSNGGI